MQHPTEGYASLYPFCPPAVPPYDASPDAPDPMPLSALKPVSCTGGHCTGWRRVHPSRATFSMGMQSAIWPRATTPVDTDFADMVRIFKQLRSKALKHG
jgi:hypothetical protein